MIRSIVVEDKKIYLACEFARYINLVARSADDKLSLITRLDALGRARHFPVLDNVLACLEYCPKRKVFLVPSSHMSVASIAISWKE